MHDSQLSPFVAQNMMCLGLRGKGLHIGHLNVQGIRSSGKHDQIKLMLLSKENNIFMLGLSESKLGGDIPDNMFLVDGFQLYRKDNKIGSGGLLVYVRDNIKCNRRQDLEQDNFESMWFEIFPKK